MQLVGVLNMFNERVRALLSNTKWERALTAVIGDTAAQGAFTDPLTGMLALWTRINDDEALGTGVALLLRDGTDVASVQGAVEALDGYFRQMSRNERTLKLEREERNDLQDQIYPVLKHYRVLMPTFFAETHALVASLPRLTPEGGHTPPAVTAHGTWDAASGRGKITWLASSDADLVSCALFHHFV